MLAGSTPAAGQPIVGRLTAIRTLVGFISGAGIGAALGSAFGFGALHIPRFEFLVAGGAGIPAFLGAISSGAALALAGALWGTIEEAGGRSHHPAAEKASQTGAGIDGGVGIGMPSGGVQEGPSDPGANAGRLAAFLQHLPIYGSVAVVVIMGYTLTLIAARALVASHPIRLA